MNSNSPLKASAIEFLHLVASGKVREAFSKYVGKNFRHHNPFFKGDAESLLVAMEENATKNPNKSLKVYQALQERYVVAVYSHVHLIPGDHGVALVHIFRFEGEAIIELWDIGQGVPESSPNEYGMF